LSRADRFTQTGVKNQIYSDFLTGFNRHPVSGDITRFVDEQAVIRAIKNLLLTNRGERPYQPKIGSNIRKMLFEPMGSAAAQEIASLAKETIDMHEPRAKILNIQAIPDEENNLYILAITIIIINKQDPVTFNVNLQRVR